MKCRRPSPNGAAAFAVFYEMLADDGGASLVEYAIVFILIAIVGIVAITSLGKYASNAINSAAASI